MSDARETRSHVHMLMCLHRNLGKNQTQFSYEIFDNGGPALPKQAFFARKLVISAGFPFERPSNLDGFAVIRQLDEKVWL
jgi:hypothetical protein